MPTRHPRTAGQQAALLIRQQILSGALAPGALLNQNDLAGSLGMSRIPIRDALGMLAAEGLVQLRAHSTASVAPLSLDDLEELYEIRLALEPPLCAVALPRVVPEDLAEMERCLAAMEHADDPEDWLTANNRFHEILYQRSGRRRTIQMINQARHATNRYTRIHHTMAFETLGTEHRLIYEAAEAGHARRLEALTLAHLSQGFETMLRYVAQQEEDFPTREEQGVDRD